MYIHVPGIHTCILFRGIDLHTCVIIAQHKSAMLGLAQYISIICFAMQCMYAVYSIILVVTDTGLYWYSCLIGIAGSGSSVYILLYETQ